MGKAIKNANSTTGLKAKLILQENLSPKSYDDIQELLEIYKDHIIEFENYKINLGNIPHRNTLIWEVRKY